MGKTDWERIDYLEKEVEFLKSTLLGSMKRMEKVLLMYQDMLAFYEQEYLSKEEH
jgi:hypothetical protein